MNQNSPKKKVQVVVIAPDENGELLGLLLQTNERRGSFWQNITGSVEKKEDYLQGAIRELWEETNLSASEGEIVDLHLFFKFYDKKNNLAEEKCFLFMAPQAGPIKIDAKEHQRYCWKKLGQVNETNFKFPTNFQTFLAAKKYIEQSDHDE